MEILELIHASNNIYILYIGHLFLLNQSELILWMSHSNVLSHRGIRDQSFEYLTYQLVSSV